MEYQKDNLIEKIVFAGTSEFAANFLYALIENNYNVCAIITKPDKPSGRGKKIVFNDIKKFAILHKIPLFQPQNYNNADTIKNITSFNASVMVIASYGIIFPDIFTKIFKFGCLNIHPSILPRWRGAAPIQRAILEGDQFTGISIFKMNQGIDSGDIIYQRICSIDDTDTYKTLEKKLVDIGIDGLIYKLDLLFKNQKLNLVKQNKFDMKYAKKIKKYETIIDWNSSAYKIDRLVKAFDPSPGAKAKIATHLIKIFKTYIPHYPNLSELTKKYSPGKIIEINKINGFIDVITGDGIIRITEMQFPNKNKLKLKDILNSEKNYTLFNNNNFKSLIISVFTNNT